MRREARRERFLTAMAEVDLMRALDLIIRESSRVDALGGKGAD